MTAAGAKTRRAAIAREASKIRELPTFEVTLRRDVQQVTRVRVQASSSKDAIFVAESVSTDGDAWNVEEHIGVHAPQVRKLP